MMNRHHFPWIRIAASLLIAALCGCATYHPHPLPTAPDLKPSPQLTVPAQQFWLPGLPPHPVSTNGLDETTVMTLAVFNNPDLKAARLQAGVAAAQLLQAGLLPDPVLDANFATSALNYGGVLGLSQDIKAILIRGAAKAAAKASERQVNLNILWQEWQVAEQARALFIQARSNDQLQKVLTSTKTLLEDRYQRDRAAMLRGDETSVVVAADLSALSTADANLRQLQSEANVNRHQLNALLGLQPGVQLHLVGASSQPGLTKIQFETALASLQHRRPDLLALQAGYESQEETVRRAVLGQFPALDAGVELERDPVEGANSIGPQVTLSLPIFNHNRGQIAIQRATRAVLRQTYQARLDAADSQADQVWRATQIMSAQLKDLTGQLPLLEQSSKAAEAAFRQRSLSAGLYVTTQSNYLSRQVEAIRLRASLDSARASLQILLGLPFRAP